MDWNGNFAIEDNEAFSRTLRRCVDWNTDDEGNLVTDFVAPYVGAWIETTDYDTNYDYIDVAPYVGAWIETQT